VKYLFSTVYTIQNCYRDVLKVPQILCCCVVVGGLVEEDSFSVHKCHNEYLKCRKMKEYLPRR
jgi:hypothetical protein